MNSRNNNIGSYQKWKIGDDIRIWLSVDTAITAAVGSKIFPIVAPEGTDGDFIVYQRQKYAKHWCKMGCWEDECLVLVTVVSDNYDNAVNLAKLIDNAVSGEHIDQIKRIDVELEDSNEYYEDNKYVETLLFTIK